MCIVGQVVINYDNGAVSVGSNLEGQELYEAYVGLTAHIVQRLKNANDITSIAESAANDALKLLGLLGDSTITS